MNNPVFSRRQLCLGVACFGLVACGRQSSLRSQAKARPQHIELYIESDGDFLAFKPKELSCPTGVQVRLTFHHAGQYISFEHNWVLIKPGSFDEVTKAAAAAGEKNGWVPLHDANVLAATPLCGKGQTVMVEFIAPAPGDYLFICTNPGHAEDMWGVLHVTAA